MEVTLSLILSAMVFKVSLVETKPIDGQKPGNSGLRKKRLVQQQLTQYPTSEELSIGKIKFKAFDLGGHQIARRVWKDYYAKIIFGNRWRYLLGERHLGTCWRN